MRNRLNTLLAITTLGPGPIIPIGSSRLKQKAKRQNHTRHQGARERARRLKQLKKETEQ
jgi:hypothetical protein